MIAKNKEHSVWHRFWESRLNSTVPIGILLYFLKFLRQKLEADVLEQLFAGPWIWFVFIGYVLALVVADLFYGNSWLKFTWFKWVKGVSHNLDLSLAEDQSDCPEGYEKWQFVHEIENLKTTRCVDQFNTVVKIKMGKPATYKQIQGVGNVMDAPENVMRFTFKKITTCVDLKDIEPVPLVNFYLPENESDEITFRTTDDATTKFDNGPLPIFGEFDVTVVCKSECYGAKTGSSLTLKRLHNELILVGSSGSFKCGVCYGGNKR